MDTKNTQEIAAMLQLAREDTWEHNIPPVTAKLRLAINSLKSHQPRFWEYDAEIVAELIANNPGVETILREYDSTVIAFAIRDTRS